MAKVTYYTARIEVSDTEIISLMTVKYPGKDGVCWSAQSIAMARQADGSVLYGPCGERTESYPVCFDTQEEAIKAGVDHMLGLVL